MLLRFNLAPYLASFSTNNLIPQNIILNFNTVIELCLFNYN